MRKELEYSKKIAVVSKLFRMELISEKEYRKAVNKLKDMYLVLQESNGTDNFATAS